MGNNIITIYRYKGEAQYIFGKEPRLSLQNPIEEGCTPSDPYVTVTSAQYILPEGYTVKESNGAGLQIYNKDNKHCELIIFSRNTPAVVDVDRPMPPHYCFFLQRADGADDEAGE